jgi:RNA polymerase-binding transcription factor DksA
MTLEQKTYEKGWAKCSRCGCLRPVEKLAQAPGVLLCVDRCETDLFAARQRAETFRQMTDVIAFPKGGGK